MHLGNLVVGTWELIKMHGPPGTVCSPSTWLPELLGPGKGTKFTPNLVCGLMEYLNLNLRSLDLSSTQNAGLTFGH